MQDIFIGIDGGATQSRIRIEDADNNLIASATGGSANIRLSVDFAWQSIHSLLQKALTNTSISLSNPSYRFHVGMGLAGCEVKDAYQQFLQKPHPFYTLRVTSDAHTACIGAHEGKNGSIIIIGTGVVGYQIENQKEIKVGGWGFPHDDEGGGAWLGLSAVKLTLQSLDHRLDPSPLVVDVFNFFNNDIDEIMAWSNQASPSRYAELAPLVIRHSQNEEPKAIVIMKKAAQAVESIVSTLKKRQESSANLPLCLLGGVSSFILPFFCNIHQLNLVAPAKDASEGGILMVKTKVYERVI